MFRLARTALLAAAGTFLAALAAPAAHAVEGLQWDWPEGQQHRYLIQNKVNLSTVYWIRSETNEERRVMDWYTQLNLLCEGKGTQGKKALLVECTIEDMGLDARPTRGDAEGLTTVLDEWRAKLTGAKLNLVLRRDGKIAAFELRDVKNELNNERTRDMIQRMEMLLKRAIAGLETPLPKKGVIEPGQPWPFRDLHLLDFPSITGSFGGASINSRVSDVQGPVVTIQTSGEGVRGPAIESSRGTMANQWKMKSFTEATFHTGHKVLVRLQGLAEGELTPSSELAISANPIPYIQAVSAERYPPTMKLDPFPASKLMAPGE